MSKARMIEWGRALCVTVVAVLFARQVGMAAWLTLVVGIFTTLFVRLDSDKFGADP
jgi:hypothetical protein